MGFQVIIPFTDTGSVGKYEFQQDKFHNIAFDKEYRLTFEAADKAAFVKYQSIVENIAQTIINQ